MLSQIIIKNKIINAQLEPFKRLNLLWTPLGTRQFAQRRLVQEAVQQEAYLSPYFARILEKEPGRPAGHTTDLKKAYANN